jgi:hypothetical protein
MKRLLIVLICVVINEGILRAAALTYPIVDTGQIRCYDDKQEIRFPQSGQAFFGQDAHYAGNKPTYRDNKDGTVSDRVTGLMWTRDPGAKQTLDAALKNVATCQTGGYRDWRVPTIKELYSLIQFSGTDPDPMTTDTTHLVPFLDTRYFSFEYGDASRGERIIDSQYGSRTRYVSTTMRNDPTMFGVNFADGRIKGYPLRDPRTRKDKTFFFIYVRGNENYGKNRFRSNGDGTITDDATGLIWMQMDSGYLKAGAKRDGRLNWREALAWAESLKYAGQSDWRLPTIKELQSIVDYSRSPKTTQSPAIDPIFKISRIRDEAGDVNYPFMWSSTTHASLYNGSTAAYIAFGEGLGFMKDPRSGTVQLLDVHGAGSQRSDPKDGDAARFPQGRGPQGDVIRITNFALCIRGGNASPITSGPSVAMKYEDRGKLSDGQEQGASAFLRREDRNGDGKVSKIEFSGPRQHFSTLDKDGDGYISENEAPTGPPKGSHGSMPPPRR